jgi:gamma-glutamyltranspeptidase/glutathione hydrolase
MRLKRLGVTLVAVALVWGLVPSVQARRLVDRSHRGMVVSRHEAASRVGADILRAGGNAIDAAVAVSMALAVVLPQAGNIGGGGFLLYHRASDDLFTFIDYRETAPGAAQRNLYIDAAGGVDTTRSRRGHQSVGVPGTVAGLHLAWSRYGSTPWEQLLEPAIRLAVRNLSVNDELKRAIGNEQAKLEQFPETASLLLSSGRPRRRFKQPELAQTLQALATAGPDAFYRGTIADAIVREMQRGGGLITRTDLVDYRAIERQPLRGRYRDLEIVCAPPPSSGGVTLLQILGMLEGFDLAAFERPGAALHVAVESVSRAFVDRNTFLGDPDFVRMPLRGLLSHDYLEARRNSISGDRATPSRFLSAGDAWAYEPGTSETSPAVGASTPIGVSGVDSTSVPRPQRESPETTHVSIVDHDGNVVALTTTLNSGFGSGVMVQGAGFLLNNEMDDFDAQPGEPNQFGLVGGEINAIAPGKRMLSSMSPTIVLRDGEPWLVLGARGGPRIITTILQIILNVYERKVDLQQAVAAGRIHHQWLPDILWHEEGALSSEVRGYLERTGHRLRTVSPTKSSAQCIAIEPDGTLFGVADPRSEGAAVGY